MPSAPRPTDAPAGLPDPGPAGSLDDLVARLRALKLWAGEPSYGSITERVNAAWSAAGRPGSELAGKTTVVDCFRPGRRRLNADLVEAIVYALHPDVGYVAQWRQALRVIGGQSRAAAHVRVHDALPVDLATFIGRSAELDRLQPALRGGTGVAAIAGMAGTGKTGLAVHIGHVLVRERLVDRVLFVNLRGFHQEPGQPPADPDAVLDGFLRLLGVPGHQVPHDRPARVAAYRARLAGTRTLVVLDNAADIDQVEPLLPGTPGCPALVTSRRVLAGLAPTVLEGFTPAEAVAFLTEAAAGVPVGRDAGAALRIAQGCGYLPLALGLVAGHLRAKPGWTLTDHADWLGERLRDRRLDSGVRVALDLSYQDLPAGQRRMLRLLVGHPGQEVDLHAAAALAGTDLSTAGVQLAELSRDQLLHESSPGRFTFHDLVRVYADTRSSDEDPPSRRRAALTRLFDFYLSASAAAMDVLHPAEAHRRPRIPRCGTPLPPLSEPGAARVWLDLERPTLVAVAAYTAGQGWLSHATRLSAILFRYLEGGHPTEALTVHGHARAAAQRAGDPTALAHALTNLGVAYLQLSRYERAAGHLEQALALYLRVGDVIGQARALGNLGAVDTRLGRYRSAADRYARVLALCQRSGDWMGKARTLDKLGLVEARLGRYRLAAGHLHRAWRLFRQVGDRIGEADTLNNLGYVEVRLRRYEPAGAHLRLALALCRQLGNRAGEAWTLDSLGILYTHRHQPARATGYHKRALAIFRSTGDRDGEAWALNGLGEAAQADGRATDALARHAAAYTTALAIGGPDQRARAHTGLGRAHRSLAHPARAHRHDRQAQRLYADLGIGVTVHRGRIPRTVSRGTPPRYRPARVGARARR